eukprot:762286-Prymnesium_polylepis.2
MGARTRPARHGHHQLAARDIACRRDQGTPPARARRPISGRSGRGHGRVRLDGPRHIAAAPQQCPRP